MWSLILLNVLLQASSIAMHHILYCWSYILEYLTWVNVLHCYFPPLLFCLSVSILLCVSSCRNTFQSLFSVFNFVLFFPHRPQPIPSASSSFFFLFSDSPYFYHGFPPPSPPPPPLPPPPSHPLFLFFFFFPFSPFLLPPFSPPPPLPFGVYML